MRLLACAAIALSAAAAAAEPPAPAPPTSAIGTAAPVVTVAQFLPVGTPVRLMFLNEITSRSAHAGDKFRMRVDEPVYIDGKSVIPVGASAWGEIVSQKANGIAGQGGKLAVRLMYLDLPQGHLPLRGDSTNKGGGNGGGVLLAIVGFGILGLLNQGDSARFKAGDMLTAYVEKVAFAAVK